MPQPRRGFLLLHSRYGGRDAPTRWFSARRKRIRRRGFTQLQLDVRMCAKYDSRRLLNAFLAYHVGDVPFDGTNDELVLSEQVRAASPPDHFRRLMTELHRNNSSSMLQNQYAADLPKIDRPEYVTGCNVKDPKKLRNVARQAIGPPIWLRQTRPGVGYDIDRLSADSAFDSRRRRYGAEMHRIAQ